MTLQEVQQLVNEIQRILQFGTTPSEAELIDLASRHEDYVVDVTERLTGIETLLDAGRNEEAIDLAERAPNLNDLVTTLDFPEFSAWNNLLLEFRITPIAELPVEIAILLNDAYTSSDSRERLLELYRHQSLARAPIAERLDTLRQLAAGDKASREWLDDVKKFEAHRLTMIRDELKQAIADSHIQAIVAIDKELAASTWSIKVPAKLRQKVRLEHQKLRQQAARQELQVVAEQLSDAYADFDHSVGFRVRSRFLALTEIAAIDSTDEIYDLAGPALDWLAEEDSRQQIAAEIEQSVQQLEASLDQETSLMELEQLYSRAIRHDNNLPQQLENRLADRITTLKTAESRRRTFWITTVVGTCVVGVVAIVYVVQATTFRSSVDAHSQQLTKLIDAVAENGDLESVDRYLQTLDAQNTSFKTQPQILGLIQRFESVRKEEQGRRDKLAALVNDAKSLPVQPRWQQIQFVEQQLTTAQSLTRNSDEEALLLQMTSATRKKRSNLQEQTDDQFVSDQRQLINVIEHLPKDRLDGYESAKNTATELQQRAFVSAQLKSSLESLVTRLKNQEIQVRENVAVARDLAKITTNVARPARFRQSLIDYTTSHANEQRSQEFLKVANEEQAIWASIDQWNSVRNRLQKISYQSVTSAVARQLAADYVKLQNDSGGLKELQAAQPQLQALQAIARRKPQDAETALARFERIFAAKPISRAYLLTTTDNQKYLLEGPPDVNSSRAEFHYFLTPSGAQLNIETVARSRIQGADKTGDEWLAPHSVAIRSMLSRNRVRLITEFEETLVDTVQNLLLNTELDPIPRLLLTEKILELGVDCSEPFRKTCQQHLTTINNAGVSRLSNWVVLNDARAREDREAAKTFFQDHQTQLLADIKTCLQVRSALRKLPLPPRYLPVGWLHRDSTGQWGVSLIKDWATGFPATLVAAGKISGQPRIFPVAQLKKSQVGFIKAINIPATAREGHRVYLQQPSVLSGG